MSYISDGVRETLALGRKVTVNRSLYEYALIIILDGVRPTV